MHENYLKASFTIIASSLLAPTETIKTLTPVNCSSLFTYALAFFGSFANSFTPPVFSFHPATSS